MRKLLLPLLIMVLGAALILPAFTGTASADITGIDVSQWQGTIEWNTVAKQVSFVMIKAGGGDNGMYTDTQFARNQAEARRLGIYRGYYYYTGGGNPIQEAEHFASIVGKLQPGELVALDLEVDMANPVGYALQFCVRTEQLLGVKPLLYTNMDRVWSYNWQPLVANGYRLWGAIYDQDPSAYPPTGSWPELSIKQYSSQANMAGVQVNPVDLDVFRENSWNFPKMGYTPPPATPPAAPPAKPAPKTSDNGRKKEQAAKPAPKPQPKPRQQVVKKQAPAKALRGQAASLVQIPGPAAQYPPSSGTHPAAAPDANAPSLTAASENGSGEKAVELLLNPVIGTKPASVQAHSDEKTLSGSISNAVFEMVSTF